MVHTSPCGGLSLLENARHSTVTAAFPNSSSIYIHIHILPKSTTDIAQSQHGQRIMVPGLYWLYVPPALGTSI